MLCGIVVDVGWYGEQVYVMIDSKKEEDEYNCVINFVLYVWKFGNKENANIMCLMM
jgi:hypothetical protein